MSSGTQSYLSDISFLCKVQDMNTQNHHEWCHRDLRSNMDWVRMYLHKDRIINAWKHERLICSFTVHVVNIKQTKKTGLFWARVQLSVSVRGHETAISACYTAACTSAKTGIIKFFLSEGTEVIYLWHPGVRTTSHLESNQLQLGFQWQNHNNNNLRKRQALKHSWHEKTSQI